MRRLLVLAPLLLALVASGRAGSTPPERAVLATPRDPFATLSVVRLEASGTVLAEIPHAPGAVIRGDVLRSAKARAFVLAADEAGAVDRDWGSALWRVDASGVRRIARGLYHASRPLASVDGRVYVERGAAGAWPTREEPHPGLLSRDAITNDAIDPDTGDARTVHAYRGYTAHLAGELGGEIVLYRVSFEGADLVAVERATGGARFVAQIPPFARDFSIDARRGGLVMAERDDGDPHLWAVETVDLASGARTRLFSQRDEAPIPEILPSGAITWSRRAATSGGTDLERVEVLGGGAR
jgi:hypothetical protein